MALPVTAVEQDQKGDAIIVSIDSQLAEIAIGLKNSITATAEHLAAIAALQSKPNASALVALGDALAKDGAYGLAFRCMTAAEQLGLSDAGFLEKFARLAALLGRLEIALAAAQRWMTLVPESRPACEFAATTALRAGSYDTALELYRELVRFDPVQAFHGMGTAARALKRHVEAMEYYKECLSRAPDSFSTWRQLFETARDNRDYAIAAECVARMKSLKPDDVSIEFDRIEIEASRGNRDEAISTLASYASRMVADNAFRQQFGGRFFQLAKTVAVDENASPWAEAFASKRDEDATATRVAVGPQDIAGFDLVNSYVETLIRSISNLTNIEAEAALYKLAKALQHNRSANLADLKILVAADRATIEKFEVSRSQGVWAYNDQAEYLSTSTKSMIGVHGLRLIAESVRIVIDEAVPGDLVECGVWRGGATILMRGALHAHGDKTRKVWVCDSFEGLPSVDFDYEKQIFGNDLDWVAVSEEAVRRNFAAYGLLDSRVKFVKGWFSESLHKAPIEKIALLRLDGDYYTSTFDILTALYDKISPGGFIIVDDYYAVGTCAEAIHAYLAARDIPAPTMHRIDQHSVYWRKAP